MLLRGGVFAFPDEATSYFLAYFWQKEVAAPPHLPCRLAPSCSRHERWRAVPGKTKSSGSQRYDLAQM
jgi:hypothetical protein